MAVNKVAFFGNTIMDISDTTADESSVVAGKQFYKANGARATGHRRLPAENHYANRIVKR